MEFSEGQLHRKSGVHVLWYSSPWVVAKTIARAHLNWIACFIRGALILLFFN